MNIDITDLRGLPIAEKLRIVTELWDDIAASPESVVVPPDAVQEASRRAAELKANPAMAIDDDER